MNRDPRSVPRQHGKKPYGEFENFYFHLKKSAAAVIRGWWFIRKNKHLEEKFNAERLAELTRQWKSRFP